MKLSRKRFNEIARYLSDDEIQQITVLDPIKLGYEVDTIDIGNGEQLGSDCGNDEYIYEYSDYDHDDVYVVPVKIRGLNNAKSFCISLFGRY